MGHRASLPDRASAQRTGGWSPAWMPKTTSYAAISWFDRPVATQARTRKPRSVPGPASRVPPSAAAELLRLRMWPAIWVAVRRRDLV